MNARAGYASIWVWLMVLMAVSVAASALSVGRNAVILVLFAAAAVKALLVARHYMHLRAESWLLVALALVPLAFVVGLMLALFPDFVFRR